jgi:MFS family permease
VLGTLSFRLREAGIDRTTIGYLSWVGLAYGFKWVWSPLVDRLPIPLLTRVLGRRRSWLLLSQLVIMAALVGMALTDPKQTLTPIVWCALAVAFGSATQDIALDAYRIESADRAPGRAGRHLPDGLPPGDDLGRRRRAVDRRARRGGLSGAAAYQQAPGRRPTW